MLIPVNATVYRDDDSIGFAACTGIGGVDSSLSPLLLLKLLLLVTFVFFAHK